MIDIPIWLEGHLKEIECPNCGKKLQKTAISGIGIKEYSDKKKKGDKNNKFLFIEHTCHGCGKTYGFDVALCDVKDFVMSMIEKYNGKMDSKDMEYEEDRIEDKVDDFLLENKDIAINDNDEGIFPEVDSTNEIKKEVVKNKIVAGITDSDVEYAKKAIRECNTYDDILKIMGITSEDMERYNGNEKQ